MVEMFLQVGRWAAPSLPQFFPSSISPPRHHLLDITSSTLPLLLLHPLSSCYHWHLHFIISTPRSLTRNMLVHWTNNRPTTTKTPGYEVINNETTSSYNNIMAQSTPGLPSSPQHALSDFVSGLGHQRSMCRIQIS